jgi:hypothetical protein
MTYQFPILISCMFLGASTACFVEGEWGKGVFYLLSAAINVSVLFLK